jgi:chromosome partitioning protein
MRADMLTVAVVNLKGGTGKTTTSAFIAQAFHEAEQRVIGVDADGENESLADWQSDADLPWPVVGMAVPNLHRQLPGVVGDRYDVAVIDTPPMKEHRGVVMSAARMATHVLVPMAPTPMEFKRLPAVIELVKESESLRDDAGPVLAVILTRTVAGAASTGVYRDLVEQLGVHVLKATVGRLEKFAQAYGDPIVNASATAYGDAVNELLDMEVSA